MDIIDLAKKKYLSFDSVETDRLRSIIKHIITLYDLGSQFEEELFEYIDSLRVEFKRDDQNHAKQRETKNG